MNKQYERNASPSNKVFKGFSTFSRDHDIQKESQNLAAKLESCVSVHRRNPTVVRHRCAQLCDSREDEHSAVTAMVRIVMLQC